MPCRPARSARQNTPPTSLQHNRASSSQSTGTLIARAQPASTASHGSPLQTLLPWQLLLDFHYKECICVCMHLACCCCEGVGDMNQAHAPKGPYSILFGSQDLGASSSCSVRNIMQPVPTNCLHDVPKTASAACFKPLSCNSLNMSDRTTCTMYTSSDC